MGVTETTTKPKQSSMNTCPNGTSLATTRPRALDPHPTVGVEKVGAGKKLNRRGCDERNHECRRLNMISIELKFVKIEIDRKMVATEKWGKSETER